MKNRNLNMLVRASVASRKLSTGFYCFFVMLSAVLVMESVCLISSLGNNIENNINNHLLNRELSIEFPYGTSQEEIDSKISEIENIEHVTYVYRKPEAVSATDTSGTLNGICSLDYLHYGFTPAITFGRCFDETESNVAIVPEVLKDTDAETNKINRIDGKDLVGKTLVFSCMNSGEYEVTIVGVYNASDPIFSGTQILIPQNDLLKLNEIRNESRIEQNMKSSVKTYYLISIDNYKNVESAKEEISSIKRADIAQNLNIDAESYNIALIMLFAVLLVFIAMVISGLIMFLKSDINSLTNELALYRSLGYKSKHLFSIIFTEHLIFGILSIALGTVLSAVLSNFLVNPYLFTLTGNTIMEMTVSISALQVICILILFVAILIIVCRGAVKRSEKIDLTVLLRER